MLEVLTVGTQVRIKRGISWAGHNGVIIDGTPVHGYDYKVEIGEVDLRPSFTEEELEIVTEARRG